MNNHLSEERLASVETYSTKLHALVTLMYECLELLIHLDQELNKSQPVHTGRIRIQWFAYPKDEHHFAGERYPLFVQWRRNFAMGLWRARRIPMARVLTFQHKTNEFKAHAREVHGMLIQMRELILIYRQARKTLGQLRGPYPKWYDKSTLVVADTQKTWPRSSLTEGSKQI